MAVIPTGNFGGAQRDSGQSVGIPALSAGQGLQDIGQTAQQIGAQYGAEDRREAEQQQRARSATALATMHNNIYDARDQVARGVMAGDIPTNQAAAQFGQRVADIRKTGLDGVPDSQRAQMEPQLVNSVGEAQRHLDGVVIKRNQSDTAATIDQFGEQVSREALRTGAPLAIDKYNAMVDFAGSSAGIDPARQAKLKQSFAEQAHYNVFNAATEGALESGSIDKLSAVHAQINGADGDSLDPKAKEGLNHRIFGYQQHLLAQQARNSDAAERERIARENAGIAAYNQAFNQSMAGQYMNKDAIDNLIATTQGTSVAGQAVALLGSQQKIAGYAAAPAAQRTAILENYRAASADPSRGVDEMGSKALAAMTTMKDKIDSAIKEDPWAASQQYGVYPGLQTIDGSNSGDVLKIVADRNAHLADVETWAGRKVSPLQPGEATRLADTLKKGSPTDAAEFLDTLGRQINDPTRVAALAKQLGDGSNDRTYEYAMLLAGNRTTAGRTAAELVIRGSRALKDKNIKPDSTVGSGWASEISGLVEGSLGSMEAEDKIKGMAYLARAALEDQGSTPSGFTSGSSSAEAVGIVAGRPLTRAGTKTFLPQGMHESDFDAKLRTSGMTQIKAAAPDGKVYAGGRAISTSALGDLTSVGMRLNSRGQYVPVFNNRPVTLDAAGTQPLAIDVQ